MALAPPVDLLKRAKSGLPWSDYVKEYKNHLASLDPAKVYAELGQDAILVCYERPGENFHRRLVAEWIEKNLVMEVHEF